MTSNSIVDATGASPRFPYLAGACIHSPAATGVGC